MTLIGKMAFWSKVIRDTFIKFLIILTILSALAFWMFLFEIGGDIELIATFFVSAFTYSILIVFIAGVFYQILRAVYGLLFKKEMSKVKIKTHVKHK